MMNFAPYTGSWRGLMWHRNYLGTAMALASVVLLYGLLRSFGLQEPSGSLSTTRRNARRLFYAIFYMASVALVWLSHSATGVILFLLLHAGVVFVLLWLHWSPRMRSGHYVALAAMMVGGAVLAYAKRDALFGLLGRNSTFTGRTGMWTWLFRYVVAQRPLLGHGFGALWYQNDFRLAVQAGVKWGFPVVIGDNGYVDIVLHVGYLGALAFAVLLFAILYHVMRLAIRERTLLAFMPSLIMTYVLVVNITLSYFLETESYTWVILVALWAAAVLRLGRKAPEPLCEGRVVGRPEQQTA
jgi:O-antigen ligase